MAKGNRIGIAVVMGIVLLLIPLVVTDSYYLHILITIGLYMLLASSLNFLVGYTGQLSIGHAAFFGVGAYASALLTMKLGIPSVLALIIAAAIAGLLGVALGLPSLKLRGPYLAITTIGFAEIIRYLLLNWKDLTRGPMGLIGIPPFSIRLPVLGAVEFNSKAAYYYLVLVMLGVSLFIMQQILRSRIGRALMAIRGDEVLADSLGINCTRYKVYAFSIGAVFAGVAGVLYAHYILFLSPETFSIGESSIILAMVIIGGMGTFAGPLVGAVILTILPEVLRGVAEYRFLIYGFALALCAMFMPTGCVGLWASRRRSRPDDVSRLSVERP